MTNRSTEFQPRKNISKEICTANLRKQPLQKGDADRQYVGVCPADQAVVYSTSSSYSVVVTADQAVDNYTCIQPAG